MRDLTFNINEVVTANCRHQFGSQFNATEIGACTLNLSSYTYTGTVASVVTDRVIFTTTGLSQPNGYCASGILTWTTGNNAGLSYSVKNHTVGANVQIELFLPTWVKIQPGDQFTITAGCDKSFSTCVSKFSNGINFGGFPHIQVNINFR